MVAPSRSISITYGSYTATTLDGVHIGTDGPDISSVKFDFEISNPDDTAFAAMKASAETAFRTPRKNLTITVNGKTWKSFSHSSGTGFNAKPEIESMREGRSANSIIYTIKIDFGRPADVHDTSYRRNSTVKVTWTPDRRMHVEIDGTYTCNGSTTSRDQYLAAIGAYASSILTALGGSYDLLEEHVENDDQNKVATFHRKYDEQISGRNHATIVIETLPNTRKRVTISGMYSTILDATSSRAEYESSFPAFLSTVLGAIGGTFETTTTSVESNDTDFVTTFTNVYDEVLSSRQDGSYQIIYAPDRRISVFFYATYFTGTSGVNAYTVAISDFELWALGILGSIGGTFNKKSESYQPNDITPPNSCSARLEFLEAYVTQAGSLPHASIRDQNYKVEVFREAPGDYPGVNVKRMVELNVDYTAQIDHEVTTNLRQVWTAICSWLLTVIAPTYQSGVAVIVEQAPTYNPDNNIISAKLKIWVAPASLLLYRFESWDSIDEGKVFDGLWTGNKLDFHVYQGHAMAIKKISKTYRKVLGSEAPPPILDTRIDDPRVPNAGISTGEGNSDPFGLSKLQGHVIHREQPKRTVSEIGTGTPGGKIVVEDITFTVTIRYVNAGNEFTG